MDELLLRPIAAGIGVAILAGPLGCFVVWRRMAYFGATLSHAALLGVALGLLFKLNLHLGVLFVSLAVAALLVILQRVEDLASDTILGILSHAALAIGLVVLSFMDNVRVDLFGYLFGDILAVTGVDLVWIFLGGALCLGILLWIWPALLAITINADLARVDGVAVERVRILFLLLISIVIALAMQVVGVLLMVSLLIIPAAAARRLSTTPESMAVLASMAGVAAVFGGLVASLHWDTPAGPSIVVASALLFAVVHLSRRASH